MRSKSIFVLVTLMVSLLAIPFVVSGSGLPIIFSKTGQQPTADGNPGDFTPEARHTPRDISRADPRVNYDRNSPGDNRIGQGSINLDQTGEHYWGDPVSITGTALDSLDKPLAEISVYLFIDQPVDEEDYETTADDTTTTESDGDFTFSVQFTQSDLGDHNWTVWYPDQDDGDAEFGIDCFECAAVVDNGTFSIYDLIEFSSTLDSPAEINPDSSIDFSNSIQLVGGGAVPSAVEANFSVDYTVSFDDVAEPDRTGNGTFTANTVSFSETYPGSEQTNVTITTDLIGQYDNYQISGSTQATETLEIVVDYTFTLDPVNIDGVDYTGTQLTGDLYFFRLNQNVNISGVYNSTDPGADPSTWDNVQVDITISGGGLASDIVDQAFTNSSGVFNYSFPLDPSNFTSPSAGNVQIQIVIQDNDNLDPGEDTFTRIIKLKGEADTLTNVVYHGYTNANDHDDRNLYFFGDGRTFRITGEVQDENGVGASGVEIIVHVTNQTFTGEAGPTTSLFRSDLTDDRTAMGLTTTELTTISDGTFDLTFNLPDIQLAQQLFTINLTISQQAISSSYRWENFLDPQASVFSFEFLRLADVNPTTVTVEIDNGTITQFTSPQVDSFVILNNSFSDYQDFDQAFYWEFTILDQYGRIPFNLTLSMAIDEAAHTGTAEANSIRNEVFTINSTNNGVFRFYINNITSYNEDLTMFEYGGQFSYIFSIADGQGFDISDLPYGQQFTLFGPDNTDVNANDISSDDVTETNAAQESEQNVTITIDIGGINSPIDNIRNVTFYFRATTEGGINDTEINDYDFSATPWTIENMTRISGTTRFSFTFVFADYGHGFWFEYYIVIYDLAGFGLDANAINNPGEDANTFGGNTWLNGLPSYDESQAITGYDHDLTNFAQIFNTTNNNNPFLVKMGDTVIRDVDVNTAVTLNGNSIANGYNITSLDQDIVIRISLPRDPYNYSSVVLSYRFLSNTTSGSLILDVLDTSVPYIVVNMISGTNTTLVMNFLYTISSSELSFGTVLDFFISYTDQAGNSKTTEPFVADNGVLKSGFSLNQVIDVAPPISQSNNFTQLYKGRGNDTLTTVEVWTNDSLTEFIVTYNITDFDGTGLANVSVEWYVNGLFEFGFDIVINSIYDFNGVSFAITDQLLLNLTIPDQLFSAGTNVSYSIFASDGTGNTAIFNQQDADANTFRIFAPPEEQDDTDQLVETSTIVTTDEQGNTVTSVVTVPAGVEEENNNALWIIAGFLGLLGLLTLYYQRHNIKELLQRRQRRKRVEGTLSELTDEIRRLGAEGKFRRAILLVWEALERVSREILQAPRRYNQTAKEFAAYLSTVTIVDRDTLLTLSATFQSARYGKDVPSRDEFEDAVKALDITVRTIIESGARSRIADDDEDW